VVVLSDKIRLEIRPLSQLRPHEETVRGFTEALLRDLIRDGVQRDPVVIDQNSGTILDGSHRSKALSQAGVVSVVACLVDYNDPEVRLFRWHRLVRSPGRERAAEIIGSLKLQRLHSTDAWVAAEARDGRLKVIYRGEAFAMKGGSHLEEIGAIRTFDHLVEGTGLRTEFRDEASATAAHVQGEDLFLIPPRISKDDVLRAAAEGRLFPPKSTLHVFPLRPLGVNYPLRELRTGTDVLDRVLGARKARQIASPSNYRGRGYREGIVVFE
jgi:hypothetical protein